MTSFVKRGDKTVFFLKKQNIEEIEEKRVFCFPLYSRVFLLAQSNEIDGTIILVKCSKMTDILMDLLIMGPFAPNHLSQKA